MGRAEHRAGPAGIREHARGSHAVPKRDLIRDDVTCASCGYHLRGIPVGSPCPECGRHVVGGARGGVDRAIEGTILEAPMGSLKRLRLATLAMAISSGGLLLAPFAVGSAAPLLFPLAIASAIAWTVGVWVLTRPREFGEGGRRPEGEREWAGTRWISRATQPAWILGESLLALSILGPGGAAIAWLGLLLIVVGVLGLAAVAIHVGRLAEWASYHSLSLAVRVSGCTLVIALVLGTLGGTTAQVSAAMNSNNVGVFGAIGGLVALPSYFIMVLAGIAFLLGLVKFANAVGWSVTNKRQADQRTARLREKLARERAEQAARGPAPVVPSMFEASPAGKPEGGTSARRMIEDSTLCASCGGELMGCFPGDPCPLCKAPIPVA